MKLFEVVIIRHYPESKAVSPGIYEGKVYARNEKAAIAKFALSDELEPVQSSSDIEVIVRPFE